MLTHISFFYRKKLNNKLLTEVKYNSDDDDATTYRDNSHNIHWNSAETKTNSNSKKRKEVGLSACLGQYFN